MGDILSSFSITDYEYFLPISLALAAVRVYLEIIGFDLLRLPISRRLSLQYGSERIVKWHRMGLVFCIGYILFCAPALIVA